MAENNIYVHEDHNRQEIRNASFEKLASHPTGSDLYEGRLWALTGDKKLYRYDGTDIHQLVDAQDLNKFGVFVGTHDASTGIPTSGSGVDSEGNALAGTASIQAGDYWRVSVAATITGIEGDDVLAVGDVLIATADGATSAGQFLGVQKNIDDDSFMSGSGTADQGTRWVTSTQVGDASFKDDGSTTAFGGALDAFTRLSMSTALPIGLSVVNSGSGTGDNCVTAMLTGGSTGSNLYLAFSNSSSATGQINGYAANLTNNGAGTVSGNRNIISGGTDVAAGILNKVTSSSGLAIGGSFNSGTSAAIQSDASYRPTEGTSFGLVVSSGINGGNVGNVIGQKIDITENNVDDNYGLIIEISNDGAGDHWPLWVKDGNQGLGKVLVSDALGKASWSTLDTNNSTTTSQVATAANVTPTSQIIYCDTTSNSVTIDLPAAASSNGKTFIIKRVTAGTNLVTIDPNGSETIDGDATIVLHAQWDGIKVHCANTNWYIMP